ncbi:MAG TPA: Ppx/GppA family phosphatase [Alphaproteobacteria bacterium]|nr:Ppx/GppA family phosphatase [Alphaproteobacteria bacterium]
MARSTRPGAAAPAAKGTGIGVIDVGSNSIRLVVYERLVRAPWIVFNERVLCGLGRGLERTGKLNADGRKRALENLGRFALIAGEMGVRRLDILATAAVRDASDGPEFVVEAERRLKAPIRVLSGRDEARLSALGVLAGMPQAHGIMGDLGGGSLELVVLDKGAIGEQATLPLGPLRLMEIEESEPKRARPMVDAALGRLGWLAAPGERSFYAVGGAWRAIARIHIEQSRYPLHVIHHYKVAREELIDFCRLITGLSRKSLEGMTSSVSRKRLETLPHAALVLWRVVRTAGPKEVIFSAQGIREGQMFSLLSEAAKREDPLISAAEGLARADRRFEPLGEELFRWMSPLFANEDAAKARLRKAACYLSDVAWREHPDYRAEHGCLRILRLPIAGLDHASRGFLALAIYVRYAGRTIGEEAARARILLDEERAEQAIRIGLALRVGIAASGGVAALLRRTSLRLEGERLNLALPGKAAALEGEQMERRLEALAEAFGRRASVATSGAR